MKLRLLAFLFAIMVLAPTAFTTAEETFLPDLEFRAKVKAKEMVFETVTGAHVNFHGTPERDTVWDVRRKNLPKPVKPGEVYRDVEVDATATSTFRTMSSAVLPRHREP